MNISTLRMTRNAKPHIFWAHGQWLVRFVSPTWTARDFELWLNAKNWAHDRNQRSHYAKLLRNGKCSKPS